MMSHRSRTRHRVHIRRSRETYKRENRRAYPRVELKRAVQIEVEVYVPHKCRHFETRGETINIGYGGMLVSVEVELPTEIGCLVRFVNVGDVIAPELRWGNILRCEPGAIEGEYSVAVEFQTPLESLKVSDDGELVELKEIRSPEDRGRPELT